MANLITSGLGAESGGGSFAPVSVEGRARTITISFPEAAPATDLTGDSADIANWAITGAGDPTLSNVTITDGAVVLTVLPFLESAEEYQLAVPDGIESDGQRYLGSYILSFTSGTPLPVVISTLSIDARVVEVIFNNPMVLAEATNPANYEIDGGITVSAVTRVTSTTYRLTTSKQGLGVSYNLTVSGIHDIYGNLV